MEQVVIERLLRARIYRNEVRIRTRSAAARELLVRDVRYDGSNSMVVVSAAAEPRTRFTIPFADITGVELANRDEAKTLVPSFDDFAA